MIKPWIFEFFGAPREFDERFDAAQSRRYFDAYLDLWASAEPAGFEGIFFSEHHFGAAYSPAPIAGDQRGLGGFRLLNSDIFGDANKAVELGVMLRDAVEQCARDLDRRQLALVVRSAELGGGHEGDVHRRLLSGERDRPVLAAVALLRRVLGL